MPGGDFVYDGIETLIERTQRTWPFLTADHARRLARAYGTRVDDVLKDGDRASTISAMRFGADLTAAEVRYLMAQGMGADRRRRAVAPLQARLATFRAQRGLERFMACPASHSEHNRRLSRG